MENLEQDSTYQKLLDVQDANFEAKMREFNLLGELTNWRTNMRDNSRRTKILQGRGKILSLLYRPLIKAGQKEEDTQ